MAGATRTKRLANQIRELLAEILTREAADPRLTMVTITGVDVDREMAYATVYVTAIDAEARMDEILQTLTGAGGFLRTALAQRIPLRSFPRLRFKEDTTAQRAARIEDLLAQIELEKKDRDVGDPAD